MYDRVDYEEKAYIAVTEELIDTQLDSVIAQERKNEGKRTSLGFWSSCTKFALCDNTPVKVRERYMLGCVCYTKT